MTKKSHNEIFDSGRVSREEGDHTRTRTVSDKLEALIGNIKMWTPHGDS